MYLIERLGEGAGVLILEELEHALKSAGAKRGAEVEVGEETLEYAP